MKYLGKSFQFFTGVTEGPKTADWDEVFGPKDFVICTRCGHEEFVPSIKHMPCAWLHPHSCPKCRTDDSVYPNGSPIADVKWLITRCYGCGEWLEKMQPEGTYCPKCKEDS